MRVAPTGTDQTPSSFRPAAGVILLYGELVLLCKRISIDLEHGYEGGRVPYGGYWSPFAGAIEEGESPVEAAARELEEESGLKIEPHHLTYMAEIPREEGPFILHAHELSALFNPVLDYEHTEYGYFKIESLGTSPCPICPEVVTVIQDFDAHRRHKGW